MADIIEDLNTARDLLNTALERYVNACRAFQNDLFRWEAYDRTPRIVELSNCAATELLLFTSYRARLKQAKAAMAVARNSSSIIVPIHTLPSEILSRIFTLVINPQRCLANTLAEGGRGDPGALVCDDPLLRVCSNWRRIATSTRMLWSHLDLAPGDPISVRLLARAKVYAARAGQTPLKIHIIDGPSRPTSPFFIDNDETDGILGFLASIATQTCALELAQHAPPRFHCSIMESVFANGVPGMLTRFVMSSWRCRPSGFIGSIDSPNTTEDWSLDLPEQILEDLWLQVTTLSLHRQYPHWTSKAYSGLVELRLTYWDFDGINTALTITESQLIGVLTASPRLRVLAFSMSITDQRLENSPIVPVRLDDLEDLWCLPLPLTHPQFGPFLRLLAPGLRLSKLPLHLDSDSEPPMADFDKETREFFARSRIKKIIAHNSRTFQWVPELYSLSPCIQVLVVQSFSSTEDFNSAPYSGEYDTMPMHLRMASLYLFSCKISPTMLHWIVEKSPVSRLTLWNCRILHNDEEIEDESELRRLSSTLSQYCLSVEIIGPRDPRPVVD